MESIKSSHNHTKHMKKSPDETTTPQQNKNEGNSDLMGQRVVVRILIEFTLIAEMCYVWMAIPPSSEDKLFADYRSGFPCCHCSFDLMHDSIW